MGEYGGINLYRFVANGPTDLQDPLGFSDNNRPPITLFPPNTGLPPIYGPPALGPSSPRGGSIPSGAFIFAGGELPAPGGAGAAMDYEGVTFFGYNRKTGLAVGSFNCMTTKGALRIGSGKESYYSSKRGFYSEDISIGDAHVPAPGLTAGVGMITSPDGNSTYFYFEFGGGKYAGFFFGIGFDP